MKSFKVIIFNALRSVFKIRLFEVLLTKLIRSNRIYSNFISKLAPNNYQFKKGSYREVTIDGIKLKLDISDYIGHFIYFGFYDPTIKELRKISKNKEVIFDIGANIGFTALTMAQSNKFSSTIYAFEPDSFNFNSLCENLILNNNSSIYSHQLGMGAAVGKEKLTMTSEYNLGENKINPKANSNYNWINISTIDVFCSENKIDKVDLIKIDVEGYEYNVLKGAEMLIKKSRPVLFIELIDNNLKLQNSSAKELISFLEEFYDYIYEVETKKKITKTFNFINKEMDIVAISSKKHS